VPFAREEWSLQSSLPKDHLCDLRSAAWVDEEETLVRRKGGLDRCSAVRGTPKQSLSAKILLDENIRTAKWAEADLFLCLPGSRDNLLGIPIIHVHADGLAQLMQIVDAGVLPRSGANGSQQGEDQSGEQEDDSQRDQYLHEGISAAHLFLSFESDLLYMRNITRTDYHWFLAR
jgi:hypothetical protein